MVLIFSCIIAGILIGRFFLRNRPMLVVNRLITLIIWVLLLSLGLEVGSDPEVMGSLGTLGLSALGISVSALVGSVLMSWLLSFLIRRREKGRAMRQTDSSEMSSVECSEKEASGNKLTALWQSLKGSLVIVGFFVLGTFLGYLNIFPVDFQSLSLTQYILYALLVSVGTTIGADAQFFSRIRKLDWRYMLLPLMTMLGTFLGVSLLWMLLRDYLLADYLAVGSGFAYYSLSSIFITEFRGAELGTIALLSNIFREILSLLLIPVVAKLFGALPAISMGGATTFDTTLPVITQATGKDYLVVSAFHGCICDFSVPFFVTFFCSLV